MSTQQKKPNILLIMTDQQRFDSLGCYGCKAVPTPNLDRLANEGVIYNNCYVNNPICTPSRASIWTGKPLMGHKVYKLHDILPEEEVFFTRKLKDVGYHTALFGKLHVSARILELENRHPNDGFDVYETSISPYGTDATYDAYKKWLKDKYPEFYKELGLKGTRLGIFPEEMHFTRWVSERAMDYIKNRDHHMPFFCCMSIFDPHDPYIDAPEEMTKLVDHNELCHFRNVEIGQEYIPEAIIKERDHGYLGGINNYSKEQLLRMREGYYSSIAFIDKEVGRVLNLLEEEGIKDNTIVFFVSDHGDMLGDHHLLAKGAFFYDACTKVPLIVRFAEKGYEGIKTDELVQPSDIAATILNYAGFTKDEIKQYAPHSQDLKLAAHQNRKETNRDYAVCMYRNTGISDNKRYWDPPINATMLRDKRFKLNVYHGSKDITGPINGELYDMLNDPEEKTNLWDNTEYFSVKMELALKLMDWIVENDRIYNGSLAGECFPPKSQWAANNPI